MAKLIITSMKDIRDVSSGAAQVGSLINSADEGVDIGAVDSFTALAEGVKLVRLHAEANCYITYSEAPANPTLANMPMVAGQTEYFGVAKGGIFKVWDGVTV